MNWEFKSTTFKAVFAVANADQLILSMFVKTRKHCHVRHIKYALLENIQATMCTAIVFLKLSAFKWHVDTSHVGSVKAVFINLLICPFAPNDMRPSLWPPGGLCDGQCGTPACVPPAGHLPDLDGAAHHPADALRLPAGLRQREQGQCRLPVLAQLVCADSEGEKQSSERDRVTRSVQRFRSVVVNRNR